MQHPKKIYLDSALKEAVKNIVRMDGGPFGACIVKNNKIISIARNTVIKDRDATCHAEINAIRSASKKLKTFDLSGCVIYSTTEPCPMCFSAIHWARIKTIVYGTDIADARKRGFNEQTVSNTVLKRLGKSKITIIPAFMRNECLNLLASWDRCALKAVY
jgi:tRNA(Arg) A34 adenosine deaminase TadA